MATPPRSITRDGSTPTERTPRWPTREIKRIPGFIKPFRVEPGRRVRLPHDFDSAGTREISVKETKEILRFGVGLLADYQTRLAAQDTYGVVMVLQAMDAAGKDGTIRHVMSGVNPQGVQVSSFKIPSSEDLDHDYLWRYQKKLPERGNIGIFNRSYYEEVLVVRVHPEILAKQKLPPKLKDRGIWKRRYREINDWERYLTDQGYRFVSQRRSGFLDVSVGAGVDAALRSGPIPSGHVAGVLWPPQLFHDCGPAVPVARADFAGKRHDGCVAEEGSAATHGVHPRIRFRINNGAETQGAG